MIRNLLATTAIATLLATGAAYSQTTPAPMGGATTEQAAPQVKHAEGHLASNLIGETVYSSAGEDGENIGSVNDLVISPDGNVEAIVVGVGGFLGIGQKNVALEYDLIEWTERDGDEWIVVATNREALEALPDFDTAAYRPMAADAEVGNTQPATAEDIGAAESNAAAANNDDAATNDTAMTNNDTAATNDTATTTAPATGTGMAAAPADGDAATTDTQDRVAQAPAGDTAAGTDDTQTSAIDRSTLKEAQTDQLSAENFIGTTVYGANEENVGEVSDVIMSQDGKVDAIIVDVGGFLGIGEKSVAVDLDNLAFMSDNDGNYYLYTQFTQEQLEAQPEYDESTFAENRDNQLLVVPAQ